MQPAVPGMENDIPGNRVDHRLRATCVRASSSALVGKPERQQRTQPGLSHGASPGWETAEVDMDAETLLLRQRRAPVASSRLSLDEILPVHSAGGWPEDLSLRREDIYEDRI